MKNAFEFTVPRNQCNPRFLIVHEQEAHRSTRAIINELLSTFPDKDGKFIKRFQTTEFESRLWELYLYACLQEAGVEMDHSHNRPDFCASAEGREFFIEAVTTNPVPGGDSPTVDAIVDGDRVVAADEHAQRVMRAIQKKVDKRYEQLPWVQDKPLGIAVSPFHGPTALHFTDSSLQQFLWGVEPRIFTEPESGELLRRLVPVEERIIRGRSVTYGWFESADSASVSALMYSIAGTVGKFHRIAVQRGFAEGQDVALVHAGHAFDPDPNAFKPIPFAYVVEPTENGELWSDGLVTVHNPVATVKFPERIFKSGMEHIRIDGKLLHSFSGFHPYSSITQVFTGPGAHAYARMVCTKLRTNPPVAEFVPRSE